MSEFSLSVSDLETLAESRKFETLPDGAIRSVRKPRDMDKVKGLPSDDCLLDLATAYLTAQSRLWPELRTKGVLPVPDDAVAVAGMVVAFKERHVSGVIVLPPKSVMAFFKSFAAAYSRYSDQNSKPTSIIDQLTRELGKAKEQDYFVPWEFVFADYAVTGLDGKRSGYAGAKTLMAMEEAKCVRLFIDDFTRASRDELEWWKLASLLKRLKKNLVGASDGFDLLSPNGNGELLMWVYSLLSRLFLKGLKEKVRRGRDGAIGRGLIAGRVPFGYYRVPAKDDKGNVMYAPDGQPQMTEAIDRSMQFWIVKMFVWYAIDCVSCDTIADRFNQNKVDGSDWWSAGTVSKLIRQTKYIGVFVYNRTRYEYDEEQKLTVNDTPRREWIVRGRRELAIVDRELWKTANKRWKRQHKACPMTGRKMSRNERSATTLMSGLMFCVCGRELTLNHSDAKTASFKCAHGSAGIHGCEFKSNKTARIIETAILQYLNRVLIGDAIDGIVADANADLARLQAEVPPDDSRPLRAKLAGLKKTIARCVARSAATDNKAIAREYERQAGVHDKEAEAVRKELAAADRHVKVVKARPITREDVVKHLADLRKLFSDAGDRSDASVIPRAAEAIKALLGKIVITDRPRVGTKRRDWVARFTPKVAALLPPGTVCDGVTIPEQELILDKEPLGVVAARKIKPLFDAAAAAGGPEPSINKISQILNIPYDLAMRAIRYLKTGKLKAGKSPKPQKKKPKAFGPKDLPKYKRVAKEVDRLVKEHGLSFAEIAAKVGVSESTVLRAYHHANRKELNDAVVSGKPYMKPMPIKLRNGKEEEVLKLAKTMAPKQIAAKMNVSEQTVRRCLDRHRKGGAA